MYSVALQRNAPDCVHFAQFQGISQYFTISGISVQDNLQETSSSEFELVPWKAVHLNYVITVFLQGKPGTPGLRGLPGDQVGFLFSRTTIEAFKKS